MYYKVYIKTQRRLGYSMDPRLNKLLAKLNVTGLALLLILLFAWADYRKRFDPRFGLLYTAMVIMVLGFLAPVRFGYVNVQFMLLFSLGLPYIVRPRAILLTAVTIFGLLSKASSIFQTLSMLLPFILILVVSVTNRIFESYRR